MKIDPLLCLLPGGIEASEAAGQAQLLNSTVLPTEMGNRADYEALGFKFGDVVEGDPIFIHATLPEGWRREGSDHAMWSYILDEKERRRVALFYKAAFYDRRAKMHLVDRYQVELTDDDFYVVRDAATEKIAFKATCDDHGRDSVRAWFKKNCPGSILEQWSE